MDAAKRSRGRPRVNALPLSVRVPPDQLTAIDDWRHNQPDQPSRPEAMRRLSAHALKRTPKKSKHRWHDDPHLLVYGMQSIGDLWAKMVWDISQFENILLTRPTDIVSVPYAYPNVCVSAVALRDWFVVEARNRARAASQRWDDADSYDLVRHRIRWSRIADDVANTFKHRGYRSEGLVDGVVHLRVTFPRDLQRQYEALGDDWERALFSLRHNEFAIWNVFLRDGETGQELTAFELFTAWEKDWHGLLSSLNMLDDA